MDDERRELIETDEEFEEFYTYCYCTKDLIQIRQRSCNYCVLFGTCAPLTIVADSLLLLPQFILNNIKLCIR